MIAFRKTYTFDVISCLYQWYFDRKIPAVAESCLYLLWFDLLFGSLQPSTFQSQSILFLFFVLKKIYRGEMWVFNDKAMAFANNVIIGGPQEFLQYAEREHAYENFRPLPLYVTLAEEAYKTHLISRKVCILLLPYRAARGSSTIAFYWIILKQILNLTKN